jgi:hypothetical protein
MEKAKNRPKQGAHAQENPLNPDLPSPGMDSSSRRSLASARRNVRGWKLTSTAGTLRLLYRRRLRTYT